MAHPTWRIRRGALSGDRLKLSVLPRRLGVAPCCTASASTSHIAIFVRPSAGNLPHSPSAQPLDNCTSSGSRRGSHWRAAMNSQDILVECSKTCRGGQSTTTCRQPEISGWRSVRRNALLALLKCNFTHRSPLCACSPKPGPCSSARSFSAQIAGASAIDLWRLHGLEVDSQEINLAGVSDTRGRVGRFLG